MTPRPGFHAVLLTSVFASLSCSFLVLTVLPMKPAMTLVIKQVFFIDTVVLVITGATIKPP